MTSYNASYVRYASRYGARVAVLYMCLLTHVIFFFLTQLSYNAKLSYI